MSIRRRWRYKNACSEKRARSPAKRVHALCCKRLARIQQRALTRSAESLHHRASENDMLLSMLLLLRTMCAIESNVTKHDPYCLSGETKSVDFKCQERCWPPYSARFPRGCL